MTVKESKFAAEKFDALMETKLREKLLKPKQVIIKECSSKGLTDKQTQLVDYLFHKSAYQDSRFQDQQEMENDPHFKTLKEKGEKNVTPEEVADFILEGIIFDFDERFYDKVKALNNNQIDCLFKLNLLFEAKVYTPIQEHGSKASESLFGKVLDFAATLDDKTINLLNIDAINKYYNSSISGSDFLTKWSDTISHLKNSKLENWTDLHSKILGTVFSWNKQEVLDALLNKPLNEKAFQYLQDKENFDKFIYAIVHNKNKTAEYLTNINKYGTPEKSFTQGFWEMCGYRYEEYPSETKTVSTEINLNNNTVLVNSTSQKTDHVAEA